MRTLLAVALTLWAGVALAHNRGTSYSEWTLGASGGEVSVRVSQLELTRLQLDPLQTPDYAARAGELLARDVQLWSRSGRCAPGSVSTSVEADGWIAARWALLCADHEQYTIRSNLFVTVAPGHLHFARVTLAGEPPVERVLTYAEPSYVVGDAPELSASFARYVQIGISHILSGWDHLAFVLALILLAASVREVALVATGFTIAHSLTLAAAVLGWAHVQPAVIEALIGFSIALVAAENLWQRAGREAWLPVAFVAALGGFALLRVTQLPALVLIGLALFTACYFALVRRAQHPVRLRVAVAFIFGLVHGFGFAGAMTHVHLPADRLAAGLLGFNSGVELGQLAVIAVVWPLLRWLDRRPSLRFATADVASAIICALGTFWFVTRAFGGSV